METGWFFKLTFPAFQRPLRGDRRAEVMVPWDHAGTAWWRWRVAVQEKHVPACESECPST